LNLVLCRAVAEEGEKKHSEDKAEVPILQELPEG